MNIDIFSRRANFFMPMAMLTIGVAYFFLGENVPKSVGMGLGWDGTIYGLLAKDYYFRIFVEGISDYRIQRCVPSGIVHYGLRLFQAPLTIENIIKGFELYNLLLLTLTAYVWGLISDALKISVRGKWLGFTGLFINFSLKYHLYYPVLTDVTSFALGALLLLFFLKNKPLGIVIVTIIGSFTWPTIVYMGTLLLVFPAIAARPEPAKYNMDVIASVLIGALTLFVIIYIYYIVGFRDTAMPPPLRSVIYLSIIAVVLYVFAGSKEIVNNNRLFSFKSALKDLDLKWSAAAVFIYILVKVLIYYGSTWADFVNTTYIVNKMVENSLRKPFIFGLANIVYYGPFVILTFFLWRSICKEVHRYGIGLTIVFLLGLMLSLSTDSRQVINFLPFFLAYTIKVTDKFNWKPSHYWFIAGLSFLYSKLWLKINTEPLSNDLRLFLEFPWQKLFMGIGHWMSDLNYLIQGSVVLVTGVIFYSWFLPRGARAINKIKR
jgi:hypothetical protein